MRRKHRSRLLRQAGALLLAAATLWVVTVTAASPSALSAVRAVGQEGTLALDLLRSQLGNVGDEPLPAPVLLAIAQSPVLLGSRRQVLELQRSREWDDGPESLPFTPEEPDPIPEQAEEPMQPLVWEDNGVPARTLVPTSPEGYVVWRDVYITNTSDRAFDASLFDGGFAAALSEQPGPQVLIVHTHGSEAYTMPPGQSYVPSGDCRTTDNSCNVVRVGAEIKAVLEEAGFSVLHDTALHDYPEYSGAYGRSLTSVEAYLEQYPTITFVLDIHRDAVSDSAGNAYKVVSNVAGINAAQMAFVIGTDGGGLEHPRWQENLKLAAALQQTLAEDYPTLMRPITVRNSRYNQHTTTGSLLVEMGAAGNSLEEALLSARLLARALCELLGGGAAPSP